MSWPQQKPQRLKAVKGCLDKWNVKKQQGYTKKEPKSHTPIIPSLMPIGKDYPRKSQAYFKMLYNVI